MEESTKSEWATHVADNLDRWAPEPMPKAWRDAAPVRQAVRHANARKWMGLCWAWRVLTRTEPARAQSVAAWAYRHWGMLPQSREGARTQADSIMRLG